MSAIHYGSKDVGALLVGGRQILGSITQLEVERTAEVKRTTPLGVAPASFQATGDRAATISQSGFFDAAAGEVNEALCEREGTSQIVCLLDQGNVAGRLCLAAAGAFAAIYKRLAQRGDLHKATANYTANGTVEDAVILQALATVTAAGNTESASIDHGAATDAGGAAYLQVPAVVLGGYTNWVVKVRHSEDDETFVDLVTFTAVTGAPTAERKTVAGDVYQFLATSRALTGAGADPSLTFLVAFARG